MAVSRPLIAVLATVVGVAVTVSLGRWQLARAAQKQQIHETMVARQAQPALDNAALPCAVADWDSQLQRRVRLRGRWMDERTVWLDNRPMAGRTGRLVLTPLRLEGGGRCPAQVVLVQRGWVGRDAMDRTRVPDLRSVPGVVTVEGRLVGAPSRLFDFGQADAASAPSSRLRQNVDLAALSAEWGEALRPGSIQQTADEVPAPPGGTGLRREWWQPSGEIGKHQAYAAQWFAMAAIMASLYVWFQWLRPRSEEAGPSDV